MDLILRKKSFTFNSLLLLVLVLLSFWCLKSMLTAFSSHIVYSVTSLETVEQIIEQVQEENTDFSTRGGGKNKPSIKEEIEHAKGRLSKNEYKAAKSNYKRMVEHVEKLEKYKQNPMNYDNLGLLKNAPNEQVKQKIMQSRIAHLEKEIQTFYNNIVKIIN
ncbi:MAG: hypothetical protein R2828_22815 [Saprospiraceae bacterium]